MAFKDAPEDNSVKLFQMQQQAAAEERERQAAEDRRREAELAQLRNDALVSGRGAAQGYFNEQGLVPDNYTSAIERELTSILAGIPRDDPNPGAYFSSVGERIYDTAEQGQRNKLLRELDQIVPQDYAQRRVASTLDDPILEAIFAEQRGDAERIVQNMLNRGVITSTGYQGAMGELDRQSPAVRAILDQLGTGVLESGKQRLQDISGSARETAATSRLGTNFSTSRVTGDLDAAFNEILSGLDQNIRAQVSGDMFKTGGLPVAAGAYSGAQNTRFDPRALAGIIETPEDEAERNRKAFSGSSAGASIF